MLATVEDIRRVSAQLDQPWALCNFLGKIEAEVIVWQTLKACEINFVARGEAFSFFSNSLYASSGNGLCNNHAGLAICLREGLLKEEWRDIPNPPENTKQGDGGNVAVLLPTTHLIERIEKHLASRVAVGQG